MQATKAEGLREGDPFLDVTMHFSRGLGEGHSSLIGNVADPSLQEGLRMREYTIKAGERKAGSARFATSDRKHKAQRQRWVEQSRQARAPPDYHRGKADEPGRSNDTIHLGMLEEEEGSGLAEESQDIVNANGTHKNFDQGQGDNKDQWEDAGAEDLEEHEGRTGPTWFARQKEILQNDRMSERGVYQAKVARTGKW